MNWDWTITHCDFVKYSRSIKGMYTCVSNGPSSNLLLQKSGKTSDDQLCPKKEKLYDIQYFEIWIKHFVTIVVTIQLCGRLLSELHNWQECLYSITTALISDYNILMNLHELIIESILSKQTSFHSRLFISTKIQSKIPKIKVKLKKWMVQKANNNWYWRGKVIIRLWIQFDFLPFSEKV